MKPGERWLCQAGHDQDEYEKVVSDEEKDGQEPQEPIVQRAKLVCSDYDSETGKKRFRFSREKML